MGAFQAPKLFNERFDYVCSIFPKLGQRKTSSQANSPAANVRWWPWPAPS